MVSAMPPKRRQKGTAAEGTVGPDPAQTAEENLVQALDYVVKTLLEDPPPTAEGVPQAALEALCELHPQFQEKAKYRRQQADEKKLIAQVEAAELRAKQAQLRRKKKTEDTKAPDDNAADNA